MLLIELHMAINHLPFAGILIGLVFVVIGMTRNQDKQLKNGYILLLVSSAIGIVAYTVGQLGHDPIANIPGVSHDMIEAHEDAGIVAVTLLMALGGLMLLGHFKFKENLPDWYNKATVALSVLSLLVLLNAQKVGGEIRHPEFRAGYKAISGAHSHGSHSDDSVSGAKSSEHNHDDGHSH